MPLLRCERCGQAYDVPPAMAVRLATAIAACRCGEWLSGSKAALLARLLEPEKSEEIDVSPYRVEAASAQPGTPLPEVEEGQGAPVHLKIVARGAEESATTVFTIDREPLWIGRKGCHLCLDDADLSIRHCSIRRRGETLYICDEESHTGTFLDGAPVTEEPLGDGVHLLRVGGALLTLERSSHPGTPVEAISLEPENVLEISADVARRLRERATRSREPRRAVLVCIQGMLSGKEFEIPDQGLVVGREGDVKLPDDYLSRRHFEVKRDAEGSVRIRDLGSRNGTFLNTMPARNTRVHPGDEIRAGVNCFRIEER
jgi:pSer/pThr/pTyr-binding forkhead associated (FHA) protein